MPLLKRFPGSRSSAVAEVNGDVSRWSPSRLTFSYAVRGNIAAIRLPAVTQQGRRGELWKQTCFEAFVRHSTLPAYYELNFSPSSHWAAYRFIGYRDGMQEASGVALLPMTISSNPQCYTIKAVVEFDEKLTSLGPAPWHIGLSAIIEEISGEKSYWALAHPGAKPDFHHADAFTLQLP